jgi:hypothetical protein
MRPQFHAAAKGIRNKTYRLTEVREATSVYNSA